MASVPDAYQDTDDLPAVPSAQPAAQPRDPATQRFLPVTPKPAEPVVTHSPYMLAKARQYGIAVAPDMTSDTLGVILDTVERRIAAQPNTQSIVPVKAEEPVDWGEDDAGKPLTEEQAKSVYPRAVFNAIKNSHRAELLEKKYTALQESIERDRQERQGRQAERQLAKVLATRPDLFGAKPDEIAPNSIEAHRRQAVINHLNGLVAAKQHTTLEADAAAALAMFGPATPAPKPGVKPAPKPGVDLSGYTNGELARPSGRRGTELIDRRSALIEAEAARQRESNGSYVSASAEDDNDDLPDVPRG